MNVCIKPDETAPLPWKFITRYDDLHEGDYYQILDHNGNIIVEYIDSALIAFGIIHYANSHAALVEALEKISGFQKIYEGDIHLKYVDALSDLIKIRALATAALAAEKGEK